MRGYACIALDHPRDGANMVVVAGTRERAFRRQSADTGKAWRHIPTIETEDVFDALPFGCVPVAVDIIAGAVPLPDYRHPERAFYVFGPENGTLAQRIVGLCRDAVVVPTRHCMNLAATVNVVLYDRMAKHER